MNFDYSLILLLAGALTSIPSVAADPARVDAFDKTVQSSITGGFEKFWFRQGKREEWYERGEMMCNEMKTTSVADVRKSYTRKDPLGYGEDLGNSLVDAALEVICPAHKGN